MSSAMLLATLNLQGFVLRADRGRLLVSPAKTLIASHRAALNHHKAALLELLAVERDEETEAAAWRFCHPRGPDDWPERLVWYHDQDDDVS